MRTYIWNFIKYVSLSIIFLVLSFFCLFNFGFLNNFSSIAFDKNKLNYNSTQIKIFDKDNKIVSKNSNQVKNISYKDIPDNLINAFISIEDKSFFKHKGINYKRIIKATLKNIASFKIKEGASTISQQLIEKYSLNKRKTFKRKINEMLLTKKMEEVLSKKEILTSYLNAIYFGSGAFGINQASQRYFSKDIMDLTLSECATLAGIIKSPKKYSPILNYDNCLKRRNIVLKEMFNDNKINFKQYQNAIKETISLNINKNFLGNNSYYNACIDEACSILKLTEKDLLVKDYSIYTYNDPFLQNILEEEINNISYYTNNQNHDCCCISINSNNGGINAFYGKSDYDLISLKRQPGSILKPVISYAPALEYKIINPLTPILDEKINIDEYSPNNYNNKFYGWISAKDALSKSLNVPSVKLLNYVGINKAKTFANNLGINFDKNDNGYSIALGGLTKGVTIKEITNSYLPFANNGKYINAKFIREIRNKDGKIIYTNNNYEKQVMKDSTAYLTTSMLQDTVKNGTCRKLNLKNKYIAAKTGTVGLYNNSDKKNTDVWNISYTKENILGVWIGSTNNNLLCKEITGGNSPTLIAQSIYNKSNLGKSNFNRPETIVDLDLNLLEYENNQKILLANNETPERYKFKGIFAIDNKPKEESKMFDNIDNFKLEANITEDNKVKLSFKANKYLWYEIKKQNEDNLEIIAKIINKNDEVNIYDKNVKSGNFYTYFVVAHYNDLLEKNNIQTQKSNCVKIFMA